MTETIHYVRLQEVHPSPDNRKVCGCTEKRACGHWHTCHGCGAQHVTAYQGHAPEGWKQWHYKGDHVRCGPVICEVAKDAAPTPAEKWGIWQAHKGEQTPPADGWRCFMVCCGMDDGFVDFPTWEEADAFRESYTSGIAVALHGYSAPLHESGHRRAVIVFGTRTEPSPASKDELREMHVEGTWIVAEALEHKAEWRLFKWSTDYSIHGLGGSWVGLHGGTCGDMHLGKWAPVPDMTEIAKALLQPDASALRSAFVAGVLYALEAPGEVTADVMENAQAESLRRFPLPAEGGAP